MCLTIPFETRIFVLSGNADGPELGLRNRVWFGFWCPIPFGEGNLRDSACKSADVNACSVLHTS